jgi:hypothetical protein
MSPRARSCLCLCCLLELFYGDCGAITVPPFSSRRHLSAQCIFLPSAQNRWRWSYRVMRNIYICVPAGPSIVPLLLFQGVGSRSFTVKRGSGRIKAFTGRVERLKLEEWVRAPVIGNQLPACTDLEAMSAKVNVFATK